MNGTYLTPRCRQNDIVIQTIENEILVYDLQTKKAFCLNETSASVWQESDGTKTISGIATEVSRKFGSSVSTAFVYLALTQFAKEGLLENG
ncbi:MAG: PqqD family protein, partial [Acidobacteria bacterium]|nr:PqqD family protein [Acidobacteriota bacterium]